MYKCPNCKGMSLTLDIISRAKMYQSPSGDISTEIVGDHEWDDKSVMDCDACGHCGDVVEFDADCQETERPVCPECGSNDITMDGPMRWNAATQQWVSFDEVYDKSAACQSCGYTEFYPNWISDDSPPESTPE